jgi:putative membrane protein
MTSAVAALAAHPYPYDGGFHWWFLFVPFGFVLFWVAVAVLVRSLFWRRGWGPGPRGPHGHPGWGSPTRGAEQALASRFAAGDIDEREYRARLEVLRASPPENG